MGIKDLFKNLMGSGNGEGQGHTSADIEGIAEEAKSCCSAPAVSATPAASAAPATHVPQVKIEGNKKEFTLNYGGKIVTIETGRMAKQADGAVFLSCEGTQILATAVSAHTVNDGQDFFPLLVDYREKFYAAGRFLGGFQKREGRPSNQEILLMRMIDRPFRPLFPEGYMFETTVATQVLSYDAKADPEVMAGLAASAALVFSDIPFNGPVGFCKVGMINGQFILNPSSDLWEKSDLELVVAGTKDAILMMEGEAQELSEETVIEAIMFAHEHIKQFCRFMEEAQKEAGKAKREFSPIIPNKGLMDKLMTTYGEEARAVLKINEKQDRQNGMAELSEKVKALVLASPADYFLQNEKEEDLANRVHQAIDELFYRVMRNNILKHHDRIGGRALNQVRPITVEVDLLKKAHGSSLFTRGETQVMAIATIGGRDGEQMVDAVSGISYHKFYLHYTFAPFCVGEAKGYRGVGRREIGHGNLAERALKRVLPSQEKFPYTIRVACEVLESNGSSSMGSICSGSMALMDAGVPLKSPVAGVAMGLIKEGDDFVILTDILGDEDHLGDMDFKVGGTENGITAIQMDIKIGGITKEIFTKAFAQAKEGRLHILKEMSRAVTDARTDFKEGVPRIRMMMIPVDKIGALIGPSGKNVKAIQEEFKLTVEISDDGKVKVVGTNTDNIDKVVELIDMQINGPKLGGDYPGIVVSIKEYGAFVDIAPNVSGLLHVSELASERVQAVEDYLKEGDQITVKVLDIDRFGKIKLTAKGIQDQVLTAKYAKAGAPRKPAGERSERPERSDRYEKSDRPERKFDKDKREK